MSHTASWGTGPISDQPIEVEPGGFMNAPDTRDLIYAELAAAGVELGAYDRRIVDWLAGYEWSTTAVLLSWIKRAREGGTS